ncbi:MAG: hypothetical protein ABJA34_08035 [Pseudonocardiales bacterium]
MSLHLSYLRLLVAMLREQVGRSARDDRGASAIEWAVITAIIIGIATVLATVIGTAVTNHSKLIK